MLITRLINLLTVIEMDFSRADWLVVGDHQVLELVCVSYYDSQLAFFIITTFRLFGGLS